MDVAEESSVVKHIKSQSYQELLEQKIIADGIERAENTKSFRDFM